MKIARITNDGTLMLKGEVIEYPSELEGGRNLWLKLSDIDLTDYVIGHNVEYPVNDRFSLIGYGSGATSRINLGNELNVVFSESSNTNAYVRGNITNLLPNTIYTLSYTLSHEGDMEGKTLFRLFNRLRYASSDNGLRFSDVITTNDDGAFDFRFWQDNAGLASMNITFTISDIKLEIGDKATAWTPAPEDLGLTYDNYINYFTTGLKNNGNLFVGELIEVDVEKQSKNLVRNGNYEYGEIEPWILYNGAQLSWDEEVGAYLFQGSAGTNDLAYQELTLEPHTAYTLSLIRRRQYGDTAIRILRSLDSEDYIANITLVGTSLTPTSTTFLTEEQTQYYISFASTSVNRRGYAKEIQLEKGDIASEYASYGEVWVEENFPLMRFKDGKLYIKGELVEGGV